MHVIIQAPESVWQFTESTWQALLKRAPFQVVLKVNTFSKDRRADEIEELVDDLSVSIYTLYMISIVNGMPALYIYMHIPHM